MAPMAGRQLPVKILEPIHPRRQGFIRESRNAVEVSGGGGVSVTAWRFDKVHQDNPPSVISHKYQQIPETWRITTKLPVRASPPNYNAVPDHAPHPCVHSERISSIGKSILKSVSLESVALKSSTLGPTDSRPPSQLEVEVRYAKTQGALILVPSSEVTAGWWRGRGGRRKDAKLDIRPRDFGNVGTMGRSSDVSVAMRPVIKPVTSLLLVLVFLPSTSTRYCLQHPLQMREPPCSMNASSSSVILVDLTGTCATITRTPRAVLCHRSDETLCQNLNPLQKSADFATHLLPVIPTRFKSPSDSIMTGTPNEDEPNEVTPCRDIHNGIEDGSHSGHHNGRNGIQVKELTIPVLEINVVDMVNAPTMFSAGVELFGLVVEAKRTTKRKGEVSQ
ncbi:hypothetical protein K438DRAFT_1784562 [Mycena galopus ATCC 62051]|nr:hypothetical protein K438DRAFT_1784562 [Mycena galopus ATCC 62051]